MESENNILYPLRENIESFTQIYYDFLEGVYEKSYLEVLVRLSKVFHQSMGKVILYKNMISEKKKELEACNSELLKLSVESEIYILNDKLDYLLGRKTENPFDESCVEISQQILQFYFDSLEAQSTIH